MPTRAARLLAVPAVVLVLAACGDDAQTSSEAPEGPSAGATRAPAADALVAEVTEVAPVLESAYRGGDYPRTVEQVVPTLTGAGVTLSPGHEVGGYSYDADAVEFVLCLQDEDGAWASYDTAPMGVRDAGESGGCPQG